MNAAFALFGFGCGLLGFAVGVFAALLDARWYNRQRSAIEESCHPLQDDDYRPDNRLHHVQFFCPNCKSLQSTTVRT